MLSKSIVLALAWSALSTSIVRATPLVNRAVTVNGVDDSVPWFCTPDDFPVTQSYLWSDISEDCSRNGNCDHACLTFHTSGTNNQLVAADMDDLRNVIGQQSLKNGFLKTTNVGIWRAFYDNILAHDLPAPDMLQFYFHQIAVFQEHLDAASQIDDMTLHWYRGDQKNIMTIDRTDFF